MLKNRLTICISGHRYYTEKDGGVEIQTRYIGESLAKSGWQVAFLCPNTFGKTGIEKIDDHTRILWYPHFSFSFQVPRVQIRRMLDTVLPHVFYQRGRGQLTGNEFILRYAKEKSIPYVFSLSSDADLDGSYEVKTTLNSNMTLWKKMVLVPYALRLDRGMRRILKGANYIAVLHEGQAYKMRKDLGRSPFILRTLHPEINHMPIKSEPNTILWVCNYRPLKQGELFVDLADCCRAMNCRFIMVYGNTKEEYINPVLEKASGKDNLAIHGKMDFHEVEKLMEKASIFVNTSIYEGFPNTFIQSWLRETPVVSLSVNPGGVITREKIGMCSGNFKQLVKDVGFLVENNKLRRDMGKRARDYAERVHGFNRNFQNIANFFSQVVDEYPIRNDNKTN